jgi:type IV secretion system protein VirD4
MSSTINQRAARVTAAAGQAARGTASVPTVIWGTAAAIILAALTAVELTGAIAGALHSHHPALVSPTGAARVLMNWLGDTGVRRGAWPASVAPDLGRYRQVRAALILALALLGLLAAGCFAMWRSRRVERLRDVYKARGARWASGRELKRLHVKGPAAGRVILGSRDGQLIAAEANASTLIVAPSQAGKTSGLAVPAMVEWDGPILATSAAERGR